MQTYFNASINSHLHPAQNKSLLLNKCQLLKKNLYVTHIMNAMVHVVKQKSIRNFSIYRAI